MAHHWRFFRAGGFDQVRLDTGADIKSLAELDPKLWVALSSPSEGLELDAHTLELLDADGDGRVRVPEVLAAAKWATSLLKNPDELMKGAAALPLSAIDTSSDEGKTVLASAKQLLSNLGKPDATEVSPSDTTDTVKIFASTLFNGDGVVPPGSAEKDEKTAAAIKDVIASVGAVKDLSAVDGVDQAKVDQFFAEATSFVDWWKKAEGDDAVLPLKDATVAAWDAYVAVQAKVDDYFARAGLAAMDARAAAALVIPDDELKALGSKPLSAKSDALATLPLARIEPGRPLPLAEGVNPAWAEKLGAFRASTVAPLLGDRQVLTAAEWVQLAQKLAGHQAWRATRPAGTVDALGLPRLKELVSGSAKADIEALLKKDKALEPELKAITSVDKLAHWYRDLAVFLNNFVAFKDFYTRQGKALFQYGTLYLDGRSCELCLRVDDLGKHSALAAKSMIYLAYCECTRKGSAEKLTIAAAFTGGDSDFLSVGRNGIFFDRKGQDWDATIVKIVEQPISVRQAFFTPYKKVAKFVGEQIEKFAGAEDKAAGDELSANVAKLAKSEKDKEGKPVQAFDVAKFAGVFAAIGLALGAIGTALAAVLSGFIGLKLWQMPLAIGGALLVISGPSMLLAAMKLRQRTLGPLLDAGGWAINARALINIPFGASLTRLAELPAGSERSLADPYAQKQTPWGLYVFLVLLAGTLGWLAYQGMLIVFWLWVLSLFGAH